MHIFSNLEYSTMVTELSPLIGRHFDRMRKIGENIYRIRIGTTEILCELGIRFHQTKYLEESKDKDKFVEKGEKELDNAKLLSIEQVNHDRIISFNFDRERKLVFEMFGPGNLIFIKDGITVCAVNYESRADRQIKAGEVYGFPSNVPSQKLEASEKYIVVSLMKLPFGKEYVLEALDRLKIDQKTPGNSLSGNKLHELEQELNSIKTNAKPYVFYDAGKPVDFSLTQLSRYANLEKKEFPTLSDAADEYYVHYVRADPKLEKLTKRLEKQQERLVELVEEEKLLKEKGDYIYNNYEKASEIIGLAKNSEFVEIEKKYKGKINKKDKSVEVDL